ncbi:MAG: hypothetical protein EBR30_28120, partial [Cytophagia bacterium]|nr:hypothetical protein [Cytophagia bacterium]
RFLPAGAHPDRQPVRGVLLEERDLRASFLNRLIKRSRRETLEVTAGIVESSERCNDADEMVAVVVFSDLEVCELDGANLKG